MRQAEESSECSCGMEVPGLLQGSRSRTIRRTEAPVAHNIPELSLLLADKVWAPQQTPSWVPRGRAPGPLAPRVVRKAHGVTAALLAGRNRQKGCVQPSWAQPGSAGNRKAAHQLAATLKHRSGSPPAYSTSLNTFDSQHHLCLSAQLRSGVGRNDQVGNQRHQLGIPCPSSCPNALLVLLNFVPGCGLPDASYSSLVLRRRETRTQRECPLGEGEQAGLGWAIWRGQNTENCLRSPRNSFTSHASSGFN